MLQKAILLSESAYELFANIIVSDLVAGTV
ncbi:hypothetical protein SKA34_18794 [Photobacterium sp. SKA34]|nr:hypothetical protein SKA34_18794 [Photobacterium sp. SKA34]